MNLAKVSLGLSIDQDINKALEEYCQRTGESKISVFERAVAEWLEKKGEQA